MSTQVTVQGHRLNISATDETETTAVVRGKARFDDIDACGDVVVDGAVHAHSAVNAACHLESCTHYHAEARDTGTVFFLARDSDHIELTLPATPSATPSAASSAASSATSSAASSAASSSSKQTSNASTPMLQSPPMHFEVVGSTCSSFRLHFPVQVAESSYVFINNELVSGPAHLSALHITNASSINLSIQTVNQKSSVLYRLTGFARTFVP